MGDILFLSHRIPFPPDRGDKIRSHHVLKALAQLGPVHVGTFYDDARDQQWERQLAQVSATYRLVRRRKPLAIAGLQAIGSGRALSLAAFDDRRLHSYVRQVLARHDVTAIYVFSGQMAQYVPTDFGGRVVADLVDVDSAKFEAYAARSPRSARGWLERREGRLLRREEARICCASALTLLISDAEADLLRSRVAPVSGAIATMGNGIDAVGFDAGGVDPEPRLLEQGSPRIVFTGQMDYAPNIEAAMRAIDRILPMVRQALPSATLHVVGRNPPQALTARSGREGVTVWGRVDDIRPWLAGSDIALVPLDIARGVQNKVLEAMSMALPVVLTKGAATGIDAVDGRDFIIRNDDVSIAKAVIDLAQSPDEARRVGNCARDWIVRNASWEAALARLPSYVETNARRPLDAP